MSEQEINFDLISAGLEAQKEEKFQQENAERYDLSRPSSINGVKVSPTIQENEEKVSKTVKAKDIIKQNVKRLYYTSENQAYAKVEISGTEEILSFDSAIFNYWVTSLFESAFGGVLGRDELRNAKRSVESTAYFKGYLKDIHLRIAEHNDSIYLDLANKQGEILEIDKNGFRVIKDSPVIFRRTPDMAELPTPILRNETDYQLLGKYLNVRNVDDFNMIIAFILGTFKPSMPKPILNLTGEAGTGKSMNTRLIRMFIDPAKQKDLLKKEINEEELINASYNQYLMAFDNMSGISSQGSDLLCVVSTGGSFSKRKLYTDSDEIIVSLKKSVILNGIDDIAKKQDLVSRTIFIDTPPLADDKKRTEAEIWADFKKDYPYILGSLVNAVHTGIKNDGLDKSSYPRMIDFGRFIQNASPALGWDIDYWQKTYIKNQRDGIEQSIESDPFASALVDLMEDIKRLGLTTWRGTATELLEKLAKFVPEDETFYNNAWPKSNKVKSRLRRISPLLKDRDIIWQYGRENGKNIYTFNQLL